MPNKTIEEFRKDVLGKLGLSRPSRYVVEISPPNASSITIHQPETVTLPSRQFDTIEDNIYGPIRSVPVRNKYDSAVVMTFPVSKDWSERAILEKWMDTIVNPSDNTSTYETVGDGVLKISCEDLSGTPTAIFTFDEVYPSMIMPVELGYSMVNAYTRLQVSFQYRSYNVEIPASGYKTPI
tara:strand:- start:94 stop:636 length:543 start_codon:yes stop_codon:yes gene_type:complete